MSKTERKVICNKCGYTNIVENSENSFICKNCNNELLVKTSIIKDTTDKSIERIIYELENKVMNDEKPGELLEIVKNKNINNDLIRYLIQKEKHDYDYSWLGLDSKYYELITKDILRSDSYSLDEKKNIVNSLKNDQILFNAMLDESIYKTDRSKSIVKKLINENVEIVKNAPKEKADFFVLKLIIGILVALIIFIFGLLMDKTLARPVVLILSIIPAIIIGLAIGRKIFKNILLRVLIDIVLIVVLFYIISYIESIRYTGFITLKDHLFNIINALPDFVEELFKRMDIFEEITEPEPATEEGK